MAEVKPESDRGVIYFAGTNDLYNTDKFYCYYPGDEVALTAEPTGDNPFMFWDYSVTAGPTLHVTVPDKDITVSAYFGAPGDQSGKQYWYQVVQTQPAGYVVDYNGHVTISTKEGLAWLISTVNGLNYQQAKTFVYDTIDIVANNGDDDKYDMSQYKWTPLGNTNHPFRGVFRGVNPDGTRVTSPDAVIIKGIYASEKSLPYVGLFGHTDSANISYFTLENSYLQGGNVAAGISARAVNETDINHINIKGSTVSGGNCVGGVVGQADKIEVNSVTAGTSDAKLTLLGDAIEAGGLVGSDNGSTLLNNSGDVTADYLNAMYVGGAAASSSGTDVSVDSVNAVITAELVPALFAHGEPCSTATVKVTLQNKGSKSLASYSMECVLYEQASGSTNGDVRVAGATKVSSSDFNLQYGGSVVETLALTSDAATNLPKFDVSKSYYVMVACTCTTEPVQGTSAGVVLNLSERKDVQVVNGDEITLTEISVPASAPSYEPLPLRVSVYNSGKNPVCTLYVKAKMNMTNAPTSDGYVKEFDTTITMDNSCIPAQSSYSFVRMFKFTEQEAGSYDVTVWAALDYNSISNTNQVKTCTLTVVPVSDANNVVFVQTQSQAADAIVSWNSNDKTLKITGKVLNAGYHSLDYYQLHYELYGEPDNNNTGSSSSIGPLLVSSDLVIYTAGVAYNGTHQFSREIVYNSIPETPKTAKLTLVKANGNNMGSTSTYTMGVTSYSACAPEALAAVDKEYAAYLAKNALPKQHLSADEAAMPSAWRTKGVRQKSGSKVLMHAKYENNYIHLSSSIRTSRVAGLVGAAESTDMANNYVYGDMEAGVVSSSLVTLMGNDVNIDRCYYLDGSAETVVGSERVPVKRLVTSFSGKANNCLTEDYINGVNNLTRLLNIWVREHGEEFYSTWRSDFSNQNNGYPIFGEPDLIQVRDTLVVEDCDSYEWNGRELFESGTYSVSCVDEAMFVDSTMTLMLTLHESRSQEVEDSADLDAGYQAYGFDISAQTLKKLWGNDPSAEVKVFQFVDSLLTVHGCDSLLILNLSVYKHTAVQPVVEQPEVLLYPNPTRGKVHVEARGMQRLALTDALGHFLWQVETDGDEYVMDLHDYPSATYYLRIVTDKGIWIKKVIKK